MNATDVVDREKVPAPRARRRSPLVICIVAIVLAALVGFVWFRGGTHLSLGSAGVGMHTVAVGAPVSFGVPMETSGSRSVVVESATADHGKQIDIQFSVIHTDRGQLGIGTANGPIPGATPLSASGVVKVTQPGPDTGATWLVATVTATQPGPWSITHIEVKYRSWKRTRTATSGYVVHGNASP